MKMKWKANSFQNKIYRYNFMMIGVIALVCCTYVLINDRTIARFNDTYSCYDEVNAFYSNAKKMNDNFQIYLYTPSNEAYKEFRSAYNAASQNAKYAMEHMKENDRRWRFALLQNMIDQYFKKSELVIASNMQQEKDFNKKYQDLIYDYELINDTSGEYYDIVTDDMQLQKVSINTNQRTMHLVSIFFIVYVIVWLIYFSLTTIKAITNPIDKIIKNMNKIEKGEYDLSKISNANQEMNVLCLALENLSRNIEKNIQYANDKAALEKRVLEQQNENLRKDELLVQSELRVLQNQINPHFLFNTLNMIYKKAYSEEAYETSDLMEKTSQLLRYALDNTNKVSSLKKEIEAIRNYNFIQEKRYGERIRFLVEVEENIVDIRMPGMILQPLVENAVAHGLKNTVEDGEIVIEVARKEDSLIISVSDNGMGMPAGDLEKLILNDFRVSSDDRAHLGLYNVTRRLKAFYGERVDIIVNSLEACGFEINICISLRGLSYV